MELILDKKDNPKESDTPSAQPSEAFQAEDAYDEDGFFIPEKQGFTQTTANDILNE